MHTPSFSTARHQLLIVCLFAVLLLLVCPIALKAQDDDVVRVNTDLVVLNVTVMDKAGQYVRALKPKDFKVYEDGVEVPSGAMVDFGFQESPYAAVVLLDSSGSMEARFSLARSAAIIPRTRLGRASATTGSGRTMWTRSWRTWAQRSSTAATRSSSHMRARRCGIRPDRSSVGPFVSCGGLPLPR